MRFKDEWRYFDESARDWTKNWISLKELDRLHESGKIHDDTACANIAMLRRGRTQGIPYSQIAHLNIEFQPDVDTFIEDRKNSQVTVLSGANNCGKTLFLKQLFSEAGHGAYLLSCNRFSHVDILNTRQQEALQYRNYYDNFVQNWYTSRQNTEDSEYKLEHAITGLSNRQREHLLAICGELIGTKFSLKRTQEDNDFSPFYVDMAGQNLRYASTGTRLLLTLFGAILNERMEVLLIDEPELGLSPRIQVEVARYLFDASIRKKYWPHNKHLFIATHSHLFLDRNVISNNFVVERRGDVVSVLPVLTIAEFHALQFGMLGNEFESIFLPSAIIIVEGDSDVTFLSKVVTLRIPDKKISIVRAFGDGEVLSKLHVLKETFGDIDQSPYRNRLFVLLDKQHSVSTDRIVKTGIPKENVKVWSKNGIEHYYPLELAASAFRCRLTDVEKMAFDKDPIEHNGITLPKIELSKHVSQQLTAATKYDQELEDFIAQIVAASH
jgi:predicted ATPase